MDYDNTDFLVTKTFFKSTNAYCGQLLEGVDYQALPPPPPSTPKIQWKSFK